MTRRGDIDKILKRAADQGFRIEDRGSFWRIYPPDRTLRPENVHKPHRKSGNPTALAKRLERIGYKR
jgi:hypothetical protein